MPGLPQPILRVAVPSPLRRSFDYLPPPDYDGRPLAAGLRVEVPFGRGRAVGVLVQLAERPAVAPERLKRALQILDREPELPPDILELARWASNYYHHPLGEVLATAMPEALRRGKPAAGRGERIWRLTASGRTAAADQLRGAPRQAAVLALLHRHPDGLDMETLRRQPGDWRGALRALSARGWVETGVRRAVHTPAPEPQPVRPTLNTDQRLAVDGVLGALGRFDTFLLYGVTGSGKTEVYLRLIEAALARGQQALVLVPEIGLTPQLVARFQRRLGTTLAVLHSHLSEGERLDAWTAAREGHARVVIGTRSAVFTPLHRPGLLIVDEEHDLSYKQQDGLRYSARDLAVIRGRALAVPVLLASATPSLESLYNAEQQRYRLLQLPERAGAAVHPHMELLDVRSRPMEDGLSEPLLSRIARHLARDGQVLLFLNRRGFAPTLLCHDCGWIAECHRCDAHMTLHHGRQRLRCHHCGAERPVDPACPACGSVDLRPVGQGTERMEAALRRHFPDSGVVRIDRDSTRRKGSMEAKLDSVRRGEARILVGTQMLAKGHHFPDVTLVALVDTDQGLFSADFRASERMAQLVLQVAGRAGRADKPGEVVIQTHHPHHPLLQLLTGQDYLQVARAALQERQEAGLPPYSNLALLRAEAPDPQAPAAFLEEAAALAAARAPAGVEWFGPVPAPMERRQGRYRAQLLLQAPRRADLHRLLAPWVAELEQARCGRKVRWSLDVDPLDMM
ncbi:MAG: primosomal protein N' [Gammaproteobacteria bacterium]